MNGSARDTEGNNYGEWGALCMLRSLFYALRPKTGEGPAGGWGDLGVEFARGVVDGLVR